MRAGWPGSATAGSHAWGNSLTIAPNDYVKTNEARLTEIQALVVGLIHQLLSADISEVDTAIDDGLARLGTFAARDRAYVFVCKDGMASNTHEWCAPGIAPMIDQLQDLPQEAFAALFQPLSADQDVLIPDIDDFLPGSPEHELLASQAIRSLLIVPMLEEGTLFGMVGFDSVRARGDFLPGEVYLLRAYADVVRSVLLRRSAMRAMRRAQDELAREQAFLQGIVSTTAAGFLVLDKDGQIVFANETCEAVLGVPVEQLIGRSHDSPDWRISDVDGHPLCPEDLPFNRVRRNGLNVMNYRIALHCDDGLRYAAINAAPIEDSAASSRHVLYAVTDATELVEAAQARERALAEAQRANDTKSSFLANMSHEIRTPLNGILGITELLADSTNDPAQSQMIAILHDSGNLLLNIINDLLDMTKIEADALELEYIPFSIAVLARRTEELHTLRAAEKRLSFAVSLDDPSGAARLGDPHRITQILHNLISNALKFTESGSVQVTLAAPDSNTVLLRVSDTGIGMTAAQQQAILQPFVQADSSISRRFGGTGLGMSIVRSLTDLFGGTLDIQSTPGQGSQITVCLPLPVANKIEQPEQPRTVPASPKQMPGLRVLAVDDNRTNQLVLSMMLGQLEAQVTLASDGPEALGKFLDGSFDLLILDISMPGMDGIALLRAIRAIESQQGRPHTPAIAYTANAMTHQVDIYLAEGFDACLTKPLKMERLSNAIVCVLGGASAK